MQQTTILNGKSTKAFLTGALTLAFMLFLNVSSSFAQSWVPVAEASNRARLEASSLNKELTNYAVGTIDYEKVVRKMQMYNNIVAILKSEPNVGVAVDLAISSAYSATFGNPPALQPSPAEAREALLDATTRLSN